MRLFLALALVVLGCGPPLELCQSGRDEDGDALTDCDDPDCAADPACIPLLERCEDDEDNDGDALVDCLDPDCATNAACAAGACASQEAVTPPTSLARDLTGAPNVTDGSCQLAVGGGGGPDAAFAITSPIDGLLRATLTSEADLGLFLQGVCGDEASEAACADEAFGGQPEILQAQVSAGVTTFLVVGGFRATEGGAFTLTLELN